MKNLDTEVLKWLHGAIGSKKWNIRLLTCLKAAESGIALAYAWLFRTMIDAASEKDWDVLTNTAVLFLGCLIVQLLIRSINRYLEEDGRAGIENNLKQYMFNSILYKDYATVSGIHSAEWMNRMTTDTRQVADNAVQIIPGFVNMLVRIIGALIMLMVLLPAFAKVVFPVGMILVLFSFLFRKKLKELHSSIREADGRLRVFLQERLKSLLVVRVYSMQNRELAEARRLMDEHRAARMRHNWFSNMSNVGFGFLLSGAYVLSGIYCAYGIYKETITFGTMIAVLQLISQIRDPFANISGYLPRFYAMIAGTERIMTAVNLPEEIVTRRYSDDELREFFENKLERIELRDVSFTYPETAKTNYEDLTDRNAVMENFSLTIRKGDCIGITGPSGCGKSTLLKLLMGMYPIDSGRICAVTSDGDESDIDAGWRGLFAYVPQGNLLIQGRLADVVGYVSAGTETETYDPEELMQALRIACADEFVDELPQKTDTIIGESGAGLSEGQIQRLAIARAIYSGRPFLLLDEATSALDEATEARILNNLKQLTDKTVLIVTHRETALGITNRVIQMDR